MEGEDTEVLSCCSNNFGSFAAAAFGVASAALFSSVGFMSLSIVLVGGDFVSIVSRAAAVFQCCFEQPTTKVDLRANGVMFQKRAAKYPEP